MTNHDNTAIFCEIRNCVKNSFGLGFSHRVSTVYGVWWNIVCSKLVIVLVNAVGGYWIITYVKKYMVIQLCTLIKHYFNVSFGSEYIVHRYSGVSILQEYLNYSPVLNSVCQILPQILPQLQSYRLCLLNQGHRSISFYDFCFVDFVRVPEGQMPTWTHMMGSAALRSFKILYFWNWNRAIWWQLFSANLEQATSKKKIGSDWPKFCILGEILVKNFARIIKNQHFFFFFKIKSE